MKNATKSRIATFSVTLILAALLNLLIFAAMKPWRLDEPLRLVFWFSYGALMLGFVLRIVTLSLFAGRDAKNRDVNAGLPVSFVSVVYYGATAVLSFLFMILSACGVQVPFPVPLILLVCVLGFYLIYLVLHWAGTENPAARKGDGSLAPLADRARTLSALTSDAVLAKELVRLSEDLTAVSRAPESLSELVTAKLDELADCVAGHDYLAAERVIGAISLAIGNL